MLHEKHLLGLRKFKDTDNCSFWEEKKIKFSTKKIKKKTVATKLLLLF